MAKTTPTNTIARSAAVLTIKDAAGMTPKGARQIAEWLRKQAELLEDTQERKTLSERYRARYLYRIS